MDRQVIFKTLPEFARRAKLLAKKYRSFKEDYCRFLDSLEKNPFQGVSLGGGVYKTRMAIASKGKGKSGGARVLTYNIQETEPDRLFVTLMSVFDKGEMDNVSDEYVQSVLQEAKHDE